MTTTFKSQSAQRPTAMGTLLQSSAYGSTIPVGYGLTQSNLLAIWAANLRQGGANVKKFKQVKKGITNYIENIDFLLGHNPVRGVIQVMNNGGNTPVAYTSTTFAATGGRQSFTVGDPHFYFVIGVTLSASYSYSVDDYGGQGPQTLTGTFEIPLWNELETGPDPTDPASYRCWPFCYRWQSGMGATLYVDAESFPAGTLKVYYAQLIAATSHQPPITKLFMAFEPQLGSGDEYSNAGLSAQQIIYPQFAGLQSSEINLGASGALPQLNPEVAWKWGVYPSGDADFVDMIEDIYKSGFAQAAIAAATADPPTPPTSQMERGLSSYQFPGTIQKKIDSSSTVGLPPMAYDMANAPGNLLIAVVTASGTLSIASDNGEVWTPLYGSAAGYQIWHAYAAGGPNKVTVSGSSGAWQMGILEVGGTGGSIQNATLVFPTAFNATSSGSATAVASTSGGAITANDGTWHNSAYIEWSGFAAPSLPAGATITAIKPVYTIDYSISESAGVNNLGVYVNYSGSFSGVVTGASLGTSTAIFASWVPNISFLNSIPFPPPYLDHLTITSVALRVEYSTPFGGLGGDVLDAVTLSANGAATVTSSVVEGLPAYLMAFSIYPGGSAPAVSDAALWNAVTPENFYGNSPGTFQIQDRVVNSPGDYSIAVPGPTPTSIALIALKAPQPVPYPKPLGNFIDLPSLNLTRAQCRAGGLWGSLTMNSQSAASDWIKTLCIAANCAPVFLGDKLYLIPYSEVSAAGNGAFYQAPTASGPVANLNADNGDFVGANGEGCPKVQTSDRIGAPNVLQMQFIDRNANYTQTTAKVADSATIGLYCTREADPITMNCVQDPTVARTLLGIQVRRNQYGGDVWSFMASPRWTLLSPMDLVTLTDYLQDLVGQPVRITTIEEQEDGSFRCEAEPFVYGMSSPTALVTTGSTPNSNSINASAGNVNQPLIFEPVPDLYPGYSGDQIWVVVSSAAANYGGAQLFVSTDGGASYNPCPGGPGADTNVVIGSATTGITTADWPAGTDPDTTNNLSVDLTESNGSLSNLSDSARDNFEFPCYVEAGTLIIGQNAVDLSEGSLGENGTDLADLADMGMNGVVLAVAFDYELMSYGAVTLTSPNHYTLLATGAGNELRRAIMKAPDSTGNGVDHPIGSRFAVLNPTGQGILKMNMPLLYIGQELKFKVCSFNQFGAAIQSLSDVTAYAYTPTGIPGSV